MTHTEIFKQNTKVVELLFNRYYLTLKKLINNIAKKQKQLTGSANWAYKGEIYSYGEESHFTLLHKDNYEKINTYLQLCNDYSSKRNIIYNYLYSNRDKKYNFYKILPECVHHLLYDYYPVPDDIAPVHLKNYEIVEEILQELMLQELIT